MKKRMIALLLLLVITLTACSSASQETETETGENRTTASTEVAEPEEVTEATQTETVTEAPTETTEETTMNAADVDLGTVDANTYQNEALGICASFPDDWYIYNETDIASLNKLVVDLYDSEAINNAIENSQTVIVFCASDPATMTSVQIGATKNALSTVDEAVILDLLAPKVVAQYEQMGVMQNIVSKVTEAEFCGQTHAALSITGETMGTQLHELLLYCPRGDLLYLISVTTAQESMVAESLSMFEAIE